jgi:hypothetical protein
MSNIFQEVLTDVKGVEEKLLGPDYPYYKNIKLPDEIGMSSDGSLSALGKDVDGLIAYVELLVSGSSKASSTGRPLGNKFFLKTGAKCNDVETNEEVDRYIYVDNVPAGNIPFISSGLGVNFTEFKGLVPGTMSNLNVLNPFGILQSFLSGSTPDCRSLTMETIDVNNNISSETHYVTLVDQQNMDPCIFPDKKNPVTGTGCVETFKNKGVAENAGTVSMPSDPLAQLYFASLSIIGIYILYKVINKTN